MHNYWIVGEPRWRDDGIATVGIAKTKTAARQNAERRLAAAEYNWAEEGERAELFRKSHGGQAGRAMSLDDYAEWTHDHGSDSVVYRDYLMIRDGIWLLGPKGERVHIAEPSQKARREHTRGKRKSHAQLGAMVRSIVRS